MATTLLDAARDLYPFFAAEADAVEEAGTLTPPVVDALVDSGLLSGMVPAMYGGAEADIVTMIDAITEVSRADASIGWTLIANGFTMAFAASYTGDRCADELFGGDRHAILAGMLSPMGQALPADGGFEVSGSYRFGSGSGHSTHLGGGALVIDGDQFVMRDDGRPEMRVYFVPADTVDLDRNWDVLGLIGTGSFDYTIPARVVEEDWTFPLLDAVARRGGPVYRIGVMGLTCAGHAGVALGAGRRALDEMAALAVLKSRLGAARLADQQLFQHDLAHHDAAVRAAHLLVSDVFGAAQAEAEAIDPMTAEMIDAATSHRLRQATTYATRVARDAIDFAYTWAGSHGLRNGHPIGRCFRDIHAATQHVMVDNETYTAAARSMLGIE